MSAQSLSSIVGFSARAVAHAIDIVIIAVMQFLISGLGLVLFSHELLRLDPVAVFIIVTGCFAAFLPVFVFLHMTYFTVFHAWTGQTIGKMIMGLKVVTPQKSIITPAVSFLRWSGYVLSAAPLTAGFLWSAVDRDHCAWHDRLADTRVMAVEMT